ncbi:hypothetical protein E5083_17255 [Streptomyces bauhiniae]|uniref:Uncharacterized protein n=1 Tax=Streptomyces bauhiniae TaxID=2340725 RepID=A0A4Z1D1J1_9ACTN|nr:hypothetical protein [Streptomyces bauhiniae]TGN75445.1 hypothetical protein E5083_17255 [Streptomyces bauhiniae]
MSVAAATEQFQTAVMNSSGQCYSPDPGTCWDVMQSVMKPARTLRTAMHADKSVGAEFWSGAYALINTMEDGMAVGDDEGADKPADFKHRNRATVLGTAHDLSDWLDENPVQ